MRVLVALLLVAYAAGQPGDPCAMDPCAWNEMCEPEPKQCPTTPCEQYKCTRPCDGMTCPGDQMCVPRKNDMCTSPPCPQYACVPQRVCCAAMTKECLSCSMDMTPEEFCRMHPGKYDCPMDCSRVSCPAPDCEESYTPEGECCPVCKPGEMCGKAKMHLMKSMKGDMHFMKMACAKKMMMDGECPLKCKKMLMRHAKGAWEKDRTCNALGYLDHMMMKQMGEEHGKMMKAAGCYDKTRCSAGQMMCPSGGCVDKSQMCDGVEDCPMGEDEKECKKDKGCMKEDKPKCGCRKEKRDRDECDGRRTQRGGCGCRGKAMDSRRGRKCGRDMDDDDDDMDDDDDRRGGRRSRGWGGRRGCDKGDKRKYGGYDMDKDGDRMCRDKGMKDRRGCDKCRGDRREERRGMCDGKGKGGYDDMMMD